MTKNISSIPNKPKKKILAFDYLRAFIIILVVLHHSFLAYHTEFYYNDEFLLADIVPVTNMLNPIVGESKWDGANLIIKFNDQFFMSLLFFISGFFIWKSYKRKGAKKFFKERFMRLGLPFLIGVPIITPLAYYSAHMQWGLYNNNPLNYFEFWLEYFKAGFLTAGPLWFLWVLLAFNCIAVLFFRPSLETKVKSWKIFNRPILFFLSLIFISTLTWKGIGPINIQIDRLLHYFSCFFIGSLVGICGLENTIFKKKSKLTTYWWIFLIVGLLSLFTIDFFTISCAALTFAMIGLFLQYTDKNIGIMDNLNQNAFGIYIFHQVFTAWLQYFLLEVEVSAILKGIIVFVAAFLLSWSVSSLVRKIPGATKII